MVLEFLFNLLTLSIEINEFNNLAETLKSNNFVEQIKELAKDENNLIEEIQIKIESVMNPHHKLRFFNSNYHKLILKYKM